MPAYELLVQPNNRNYQKKKEDAKIRLEFLLTEYTLPKDFILRQEIYREIVVLLDIVNK
jgi:hypothetical protein